MVASLSRRKKGFDKCIEVRKRLKVVVGEGWSRWSELG